MTGVAYGPLRALSRMHGRC